MRTMIVLAMVSLLLLAACESGSVSTSGTQVKTGDGGVQVNAPGVEVKTDTTGTEVKTEGGLSKTLGDIFAAKKGITYKVDYDVVANGVTTKMTQIMKLPKFAVITMASGVESRMFYDGTDVIVCTKQAEWQCMKLSQGQQQVGTMDTEKSLETSDTSMKPKGVCSKAGETGVAFDITTQGSTVSVCYTLDGIPLEMKTTAAGVSTTMVATKVSRSVSDAEFVPPATPQDLSQYMQGYGQ